jgi:dipeptidyl aminopeptidase/acylaminoacyl peptidase
LTKSRQIYSIELEGFVGLKETLKRLSPPGYFIHPMIDKNGEYITFWGKTESEIGFNIWTSKADGTALKKITDDRALNGHPFWSADGTNIVFFSSLGISNETEWEMSEQFDLKRSYRNLWIMNRDGNNRKQITEGPYIDERPCMSPENKEVVFVSNRSGYMNLWRINLISGNLDQLTDHKGLDYRPIFSPDGKQIAFFSDNNPERIRKLCIIHLPYGEIEWPKIPDIFKWSHGPFWLSDNKSLMFHGCSLKENKIALWIMDLVLKSLRKVRIPGYSRYMHGSINQACTIMAFDM